ncbi:MAG TPA: response regulator [Burkholderiales bacterium]|nr:response regulator [Burkholderiales bacterium]HXZ91526.1 response regulator [Burkholderiales bacterium]
MSEVPHKGKDILVVDDDAIMRDLICDWLVSAGYAVRRASDCHAAAAQLEAGAPALVVSDLWMPGPRGAEAIRCLRQMHPEVAVIAVSGHFGSGQGCSKREAMQAGAARAFAKPVKRAELLGAVAELIGPPRG